MTRLSACLLLLTATVPGAAAEDVAALLRSWRLKPAWVHPSARLVEGRQGKALELAGGGVEAETAGTLTAETGSVDLWLRTPKEWPAKEDVTLLHLGETAHTHVTLFFRSGALQAVYKASEELYSSVRAPETAKWDGASWHRVQFSWRSGGAGVEFFLAVDGRWIGSGENRRIAEWPARLYLGARGRGRYPWPGLLGPVTLRPTPAQPPGFTPGRRVIEVNAQEAAGECYNFWSIQNFTSQHMFADPAERAVTIQRHPFMKQVNCVRLIGGREDGRNEWFHGVDAQGRPRCDFTGLVKYLRSMMDWGYTPRLVLDNVPTAMSLPPQMNTYGNTHPPKDYNLYHAYIQALTRALVNEFGAAGAGQWRYRVMTEPDLFPGHWAGTREEWLKLYDYAVDAVTQVIPDADIGPGNILDPSGGERAGREKWGLEIVDHCAQGRNYRTGATGTRMRHFSCSWYGRVGRSNDDFDLAIRAMRERLGRYPRFHDLPVEVAEFSVLTDEAGRRLESGEATEWSGSFLASIAARVYRLNVAQVHLWGTSAALRPIPYAHVLTLLERMAGGRQLAVTALPVLQPGDSGDAGLLADCSAIASAKDGRLLVLVYNHRPQRKPAVEEQVTLRVRDPRMKRGAAWGMTQWPVDARHGVFVHALYEDCEKAGLQPLPSAPIYGNNFKARFGAGVSQVLQANQEKYDRLAQLVPSLKNEPVETGDGLLELPLSLPGHSVRLIELMPPGL